MPFDPTDKHADITLSLSDVRAEDEFGSNFVWRQARSVDTYGTADKIYFEVEIIADTSSVNASIGITQEGETLNDPVDSGSEGFSWRGDSFYHNNSFQQNSLVSFGTGDIVGVAIDLVNKEAFYSINNSYTDVLAAQDPATRTNPAFTGLSAIEDYKIGWAAKRTGYTVELHDEFTLGTYSPPSGYSWAAGAPPTPQEISVEGNGVIIVNGATVPDTDDDTDWYYRGLNTTTPHTFTIRNLGDIDLNLTGSPIVTISGDAEFTLNTDATTPIAGGGSATFIIDFIPVFQRTYNAVISIASDDSDENPFTFAISGKGNSGPAPLGPGNDFTADSSAIVLYDFEEDPGFLNSSQGSLQPLSIAPEAEVTQNFVAPKVGLGSMLGGDDDFSRGHLEIDHANLDNGFPFGPGASVSDLTVCAWVKTSVGGAVTISKKNWNTDHRPSWRFTAGGGPLNPSVWFGRGQTATAAYREFLGPDTIHTDAIWMHYALRYDYSTRGWTLDLYRADTGASEQHSGTSNQDPLSDTTAQFNIFSSDLTVNGSGADEVVIFNELKSDVDIEKIINQDFGSSGTIPASNVCIDPDYSKSGTDIVNQTALLCDDPNNERFSRSRYLEAINDYILDLALETETTIDQVPVQITADTAEYDILAEIDSQDKRELGYIKNVDFVDDTDEIDFTNNPFAYPSLRPTTQMRRDFQGDLIGTTEGVPATFNNELLNYGDVELSPTPDTTGETLPTLDNNVRVTYIAYPELMAVESSGICPEVSIPWQFHNCIAFGAARRLLEEGDAKDFILSRAYARDARICLRRIVKESQQITKYKMTRVG